MKMKKVVNNCFMLTILLVFIFLCVIMLRNRMVQARESVQYEKTFQSIEIESGTTLTSIAQEYSISDYDNYIEEVKKIIIEQLSVDAEKVTPEAQFVNDLGADSLDTVELIMALEEKFDVQIPDEKAEKIKTVGEAIEYIEANAKK